MSGYLKKRHFYVNQFDEANSPWHLRSWSPTNFLLRDLITKQKTYIIISDALVTTTKNMHGNPKKLLYMSREREGLAMLRFVSVQLWVNYKTSLAA